MAAKVEVLAGSDKPAQVGLGESAVRSAMLLWDGVQTQADRRESHSLAMSRDGDPRCRYFGRTTTFSAVCNVIGPSTPDSTRGEFFFQSRQLANV